MKLCERCICAIRSHGEKIFVGDYFDPEEVEKNSPDWDDRYHCDWCDERDIDLYEVEFG